MRARMGNADATGRAGEMYQRRAEAAKEGQPIVSLCVCLCACVGGGAFLLALGFGSANHPFSPRDAAGTRNTPDAPHPKPRA